MSDGLENNDVLSVLVQAFDSFNRSADRLSAVYKRLASDSQEKISATYSLEMFDLLCGALECIADGIVVMNRNGEIVYFNEAAKYLTELKSASVLEKNYSEGFRSGDPPEKIKTDEPKNYQKRFSNGTKVEAYTKPIIDKYGSAIGTAEILTTRGELNIPDPVVRSIKAIGDIIKNIVHRMKSPLGAIQLFTELLKSDLDDDKQDIVDEILASVHSLDAVLSNLLSSVQPVAPCMQRLNFISVLEESLAFASLAIKQQDIKLERKYQEHLYCYGDLEQLKQVCFNIVLNAIQAMPEGGILKVSASYSENMEHINVEIEDGGCGILEELMDRMFTPFFTTKEGGTGLGLYVVYRIIQAHKGTININSIHGSGTKVSLKLLTQDY